MRQPPNPAAEQESGAAATYVAILLFGLHHDGDPARAGSRAATTEALVLLCADILRAYLELDDGGGSARPRRRSPAGAAAAGGGTQARNMAVWRPVVVDVLEEDMGFRQGRVPRARARLCAAGRGVAGEGSGELARAAGRAAEGRCAGH